MKKSTTARLAAGLSLMALASAPTFAATEYTLTAGLTAAQLVDILVPATSGINVIGGSQSFSGAFGGTTALTAAGKFEGGLSSNPGPASVTGLTGLPFDDGVIITSGSIDRSNGTTANPNGSDRINKSWESPGSGLLEDHVPIADTFGTHDAATLSFRFTLDPGSDLFVFQYAFASDEYSEYVGSEYSDAFAFVLTDETLGTEVNLATILGSPVSVNSINGGVNSAHYTDNAYVSSTGGSTYLLEYDGIAGGLTSLPLFAIGDVDPTHTYRIDLVIADVGDDQVDSAVFLRANSFIAPPPLVPEPSTYIGALALAGLVARRLRRSRKA